jgi:hypothetical protein
VRASNTDEGVGMTTSDIDIGRDFTEQETEAVTAGMNTCEE